MKNKDNNSDKVETIRLNVGRFVPDYDPFVPTTADFTDGIARFHFFAGTVIESMRASTTTKSVSIAYNFSRDIAEIVFSTISTLSNLESLEIYNYDDDLQIELLTKVILNNTKLAYIDLSQCKLIGEEDDFDFFFDAMRGCSSLRKISLEGVDIPNSLCCGAFMRAISQVPKLEFELMNENVRDGSVDPLGTMISKNILQSSTKLKDLILLRNNLNHEDGVAIAEGLEKTKVSLEKIDISDNDFGDKAGMEIVRSIAHHHLDLETLILCNCGLGNNSANVIADILKYSKALKYLDLSGNNNIGDEGSNVIAHALESNNTLEKLKLEGCDIGDNACITLAHVLKSNRTITLIDIESQRVTHVGYKALSDALVQNFEIETLEVDDMESSKNQQYVEKINFYLNLNRNCNRKYFLGCNENEVSRDRYINQMILSLDHQNDKFSAPSNLSKLYYWIRCRPSLFCRHNTSNKSRKRKANLKAAPPESKNLIIIEENEKIERKSIPIAADFCWRDVTAETRKDKNESDMETILLNDTSSALNKDVKKMKR